MSDQPKPLYELAKLRILQERARREMEDADNFALIKRRAWEKAWNEYLNEAESSGLCRVCLKPRSEGDHSGDDHILLAAKEGEA